MSISIRIGMDRQAALAAGRMVGEWELVELDPAAFMDRWSAVAGSIDLGTTPPTLRQYRGQPVRVAEATCAAVVESVGAIDGRIAEELAAYAREVEAWAADPIQSTDRTDSFLHGVEEYRWEKWEMRPCPSAWGRVESEATRSLRSRTEAESARLVEEHNAPHLEVLEARRAEANKRAETAKVEAEQERRRVIAQRAVRRLETGWWEQETGTYNERRHGAPWCARVSYPNGTKAVYEFGESSGAWGKAGELRVRCAPGDIIAWGQKDLRRPDKSDHKMLVMRSDGRMSEVHREEGYRLWRMSVEERIAAVESAG